MIQRAEVDTERELNRDLNRELNRERSLIERGELNRDRDLNRELNRERKLNTQYPVTDLEHFARPLHSKFS